jgi:hypothetical protein
VVFWTSSAANEDAQESDDIRGSFFTHHVVSALLGAADANGDGVVTLGEAYDHAYQATLRSTSRTLAGPQHATFRHETHGMTDVVLTRLGGRGGDRALLSIPDRRDYLIFQGGPDGAVVAEVGAHDGERRVSMRPGRYYVRGRTPDTLLEGTVSLAAGDRRAIDEESLDHVAFARLVRKGMGVRDRASNLEVGYMLSTPRSEGATACQGLVVGTGLDLPVFSFTARAFGCLARFDNEFLAASSNEFGAELRVLHTWDGRWFSLSGGALAGASLLVQRFESRGAAPSRTSPAAHAGLAGVLAFDVIKDVYVAAEIDGLASFFPQQSGDHDVARAALLLRGNALVGKRW